MSYRNKHASTENPKVHDARKEETAQDSQKKAHQKEHRPKLDEIKARMEELKNHPRVPTGSRYSGR